MNVPITLPMGLPPENAARLAELAAGAGITPEEMAVCLLQGELDKEEAAAPASRIHEAGLPAAKPAPLAINIGGLLTGAEALQLDTLALKHGVPPEALAAATVRRLLKRDRQKPQTFRLRMPETAKHKLEEHARALGCGAGELAAFLFSRRAGRPHATLARG